MVASREVLYLDDFTGGLNLSDQVQSLPLNQTPDALNMDYGLRGGFIIRGGFQSQDYNSFYNGSTILGSTYYSDDVVLMLSSAGTLYEWDGSNLTSTAQSFTDNGSERVRMANFNRKTYFANGRGSGSIVMASWNGSTKSTLTNTWNNDYTLPDSGDMPKARHIASHQGFMWVADTNESGTRYPHRVRFSHLQNPEDWAEADYFDVDPDDDGDPITALFPFREILLVFKKNSVYAVYGYDRDTFTLERVTDSSGIGPAGQPAASAGVCYWFSTQGQLMAYNGDGVVPVVDSLRWWADVNKIKAGGAHKLMWADGRLWMRLEAGTAEAVNYWLFVYDPSVGSRGAVTRYDPQVVELFEWKRLGSDSDLLFQFETDQNLYRFDRTYSTDTVDSGSGPAVVRIEGYYRTAWITAGETVTKKRWKRPRVTVAADGDTTVTMEVYHDFDESNPARTSEIVVETGDASVWDTMLWDDNEWSSPEDDFYEFTRQPSGGSSYAVQFLFKSNDNAGRWWVDSIALPFRRRSVR